MLNTNDDTQGYQGSRFLFMTTKVTDRIHVGFMRSNYRATYFGLFHPKRISETDHALTSFMQSLVAVARCSRLYGVRFHVVSWLGKAEIRPPLLLRSKRKLCDNENHVICQQTCLLLSCTHIQTCRHKHTHRNVGRQLLGCYDAMRNEVGKCGPTASGS